MTLARHRLALGVVFWSATLLGIAGAFSRLPGAEKERGIAALSAIATNVIEGAPRRTIEFAGAYPWLEAGDGIYRRSDFDLVRCGQVIAVSDVATGRRVEVFFDPAIVDRLSASAKLMAFSSGASISWTFRSLLPEQVRDRITAEWNTFVDSNEQRVREVLLPVARQILLETAPLLLSEADAALLRHRAELDAIVKRYRNDVLDPRLLPILETKVWPLLIQHLGPLLRDAGNELWDAMPVASLAWNGVAQNFDLSKASRVSARFDRYLEEQALPILKRRTVDIQRALAVALREAASDPEIEAEVEHALGLLLHDAELRRLLLVLSNEVAASDTVRAAVKQRLAEPAVAEALLALRKELDGVFQRIGRRVVFSNEETLEVHPDFARFLRTLVLKKDRRWIYLEEGALGAAPLPATTTLAGTLAPE